MATSLCEPWREFIEAQLRLRRNATAIYQDLVDSQGFAGRYNSVKHFCAKLRHKEPEQFDRLSFLPGEEMQVGADRLLARVTGLFGYAQAYQGYLFTNLLRRLVTQLLQPPKSPATHFCRAFDLVQYLQKRP